MPTLNEKLSRGFIAGCLATIPMTAVMAAFFRRLPWSQRYAPPPHQVAMELAEVAQIKQHLDPEARLALTTVSHFGYGATMGAIYGAAADSVPGSPAVRGAAFGLTVWGASYLGWLPAAGFQARAEQQSPQRNCMMIMAHLVFGATLGVLHDRFIRAHQRPRTPASTTPSHEDQTASNA